MNLTTIMWIIVLGGIALWCFHDYIVASFKVGYYKTMLTRIIKEHKVPIPQKTLDHMQQVDKLSNLIQLLTYDDPKSEVHLNGGPVPRDNRSATDRD